MPWCHGPRTTLLVCSCSHCSRSTSTSYISRVGTRNMARQTCTLPSASARAAERIPSRGTLPRRATPSSPTLQCSRVGALTRRFTSCRRSTGAAPLQPSRSAGQIAVSNRTRLGDAIRLRAPNGSIRCSLRANQTSGVPNTTCNTYAVRPRSWPALAWGARPLLLLLSCTECVCLCVYPFARGAFALPDGRPTCPSSTTL
ncbi:hypothetical protein F4808DRAFT_185104 [Astrocystis sublimbata]|nr:hypothetical protein F4808DRAFT_185104 [Astrocystis sublimbata]